MKSDEPDVRDWRALWQAISWFHGPRRYENGSPTAISGGVGLVEGCPDSKDWPENSAAPPPDAPGAVWGWFVGSPRVFLFGLTRSQGAATRKMRAALQHEHLLLSPRRARRPRTKSRHGRVERAQSARAGR